MKQSNGFCARSHVCRSDRGSFSRITWTALRYRSVVVEYPRFSVSEPTSGFPGELVLEFCFRCSVYTSPGTGAGRIKGTRHSQGLGTVLEKRRSHRGGARKIDDLFYYLSIGANIFTLKVAAV